MGRPGGWGAESQDSEAAGDLDQLVAEGIGALVSLTETPLDGKLISEKGLSYLHLPIADMSAPSMRQIDEVMGFVEGAADDGVSVALHCGAGLGRTGTMLACYLLRHGRSADEATCEVRRLRPGSIETSSQELAIGEYARHLEG